MAVYYNGGVINGRGDGGVDGNDNTRLVGGLEEAYAAAKPLLLSMGQKTIYCGGAGNVVDTDGIVDDDGGAAMVVIGMGGTIGFNEVEMVSVRMIGSARASGSLYSFVDGTNSGNMFRVPEWKEAILEEMRALEKSGTWEVMELPKKKKIVGCKWVFTTKYRSDGSLDRYKACLGAKEFTETYGIDYLETFAPMAK
ncbi:hypothetical protein RJ639_047656 [Escallonia herrerae]|uniref:Reverse transcriptase Ty1/copia-type domain-containing protein n=1 Tax=Escallonia herrerae TaxID=1293975 RepID=A0AA89B266_9ASTE|nr:hypothetical protein RJ639_047656 [Escallonia herrerae]